MMMKKSVMYTALFAVVLLNVTNVLGAFGSGDRVMLSDVQTLTLGHGKMTNARRSSAVPQLKCVGGTAAHTFVPQVVQCYNRGSDGMDIQWECKTDMDNAYRFGSVEVTCEGYDYPEDPYILRGSCGLEYTLDLTKEGQQQQHNQGQHEYYKQHGHGNDYHDTSSNSHSYGKRASSVIGDVVMLAIVAVIIYGIYKTCVASSANAATDDGGTGSTFRDHRGSHGSGPPPPGFRPEYMPGGDSCSGTYGGSSTHTGSYANPTGGRTGGGFWTGAATGGILGYLFGNRNQGYGNYGSGYGTRSRGWGSWGGSQTYQRPSHTSWGSSWGSSGSSFAGSSGSSGTRTASGFGGTKRR